MDFKEISSHKKQFIELLLLAGEQEDMIDRYLERGMMSVMTHNGANVIAVVTDEGNGVCQLRNIATTPEAQRNGYGRAMIGYLSGRYRLYFHTLLVVTRDSPITIPFFKKCGFSESQQAKKLYTANHSHPMIEGGEQLADMVYLKKYLRDFYDYLKWRGK